MAFVAAALPAIFATTSTTAATTAATAAATTAATAGTTAAAAAGFDVLGTAAGAGATAAATAPAWMGYTSLALTGLGGVTGALGQLQSASAQKASAEYNAAVANNNATQAQRNQELASEAGIAQEAMQQRKTRALAGSILANQAASGVDVNSGSALDVRSSAAELGELDALSVRSNATKEAYGYQVQKAGFEGEANLEEQEAKSADTAGGIGAASTLLGAIGSGASNYYKYQLSGGFSA